MAFQPSHEVHVVNRTVLDDLGQPRAELARRQGIERIEIAHHQQRLVKRANHVLAQGVIDTRSCRPTEESTCANSVVGTCTNGHAAHIAGSCKPRHVAHHAPAKGKQHGIAIAAVLKQGIEDQVQGLPGFVRFTIRQDHPMDVRIPGGQTSPQGMGVQRLNRCISDNERGCCRGQRGIAVCYTNQSQADDDGIAAIP
jgi:hypothetical protein